MTAKKPEVTADGIEVAYKDCPMTVTKRSVRGKEYIVKSIFIGKQDIQTAILTLAEKRAVKEMGLQ